MKLFNRKICLFSPPKSNIIVFDETNSHYITDFILDGFAAFTYNMRPENIYANPSIIYYFLKSLVGFNWREIMTRKRKLQATISELLHHYRLSCFQFMGPKVVITFIDNSSGFHWLAKNLQSAQFFAIQNGNRNIEQLERTPQYHQHFFCYGNYEKDLYRKFNYTVENYHPVGSIVSDYYKSKIEENNSFISKHLICIVSVWPAHTEELFKSIKLMDTLMAEYIKDQNIDLAILLRNPNNYKSDPQFYNNAYRNEKSYYKSLYGSDVKLIEQNKERMSTYEIMSNSEIVVGCLTTAVREAFGWGKKILYCDFTNNKKYHNYNSIIMHTRPNYKDFKKRLDELRCEPYEEYRKRTKNYASYLMNNNPDCPSHIYIRNKIEEYL